MQLTLDHLTGPGHSILNIYEKWAMFDFIDRRLEQTGLMVYEEENYRFRLPFQFGEMNFSAASKMLGPNHMRLTHWTCKHSSVYLRNHLTSFIESESGIKAIYAQVRGSGKDQVLEESLPGKTYFLLRDYPIGITRFPKIENHSNQADYIKTLHGAHVQLKVRINQDWVQAITSIPFVVDYISIKGDEITIFGTNETEFMIKGFKKIRPKIDQGCIIFDVYDQTNGYSLSFEMSVQKHRN